MSRSQKPCRCGHDGSGPHPCHWQHYTCGEPAKEREYVRLTGHAYQNNMVVTKETTWACDKHWDEYQTMLRERQADFAKPQDSDLPDRV